MYKSIKSTVLYYYLTPVYIVTTVVILKLDFNFYSIHAKPSTVRSEVREQLSRTTVSSFQMHNGQDVQQSLGQLIMFCGNNGNSAL